MPVGEGAAAPPQSPYNPARLILSLWARTDYSGAPWLGTASAGVSGDGVHDLVSANVLNDPGAGAPLNGFTPASFVSATPSYLVAEGNFSNYFSTAPRRGSIVGLAKFNAAVADAGAGSRILNPGVVCQETPGNSFCLGFSTSGMTLAIQNENSSYSEAAVALAIGAYACFMTTWNGAEMTLQVNSGNVAVQSCDGPTSSSIALNVGLNTTSVSGVDMDLAELMFFPYIVPQGQYFLNLKDEYFNLRYNLSL